MFIQWMPLLEQMFTDNQQASLWLIRYLAENDELVVEILIDHSNGEVREQFSNLIKTVIRVSTS